MLLYQLFVPVGMIYYRPYQLADPNVADPLYVLCGDDVENLWIVNPKWHGCCILLSEEWLWLLSATHSIAFLPLTSRFAAATVSSQVRCNFSSCELVV
ncbi:hypothetical protein Nepgr_009319 [Nepenthes gracilis]|uniref:Uncharacterized protein n=1 Tax=Nepenthes gracilis TaxID=150966 RepID=A0AAD3SB99_NEPGR|nr:hypothetical protein Nepgr_009319 [Nepenthes gracilis]